MHKRMAKKYILFFHKRLHLQDSEDDYRSGSHAVAYNNLSKNSTHLADHTRQTTDNPGLKPFSKSIPYTQSKQIFLLVQFFNHIWCTILKKAVRFFSQIQLTSESADEFPTTYGCWVYSSLGCRVPTTLGTV